MSFSQNLSFGGLGTFSFTAPAPAIYHFHGTITGSLGSQDASQPVPPSSVPAIGSAPYYQGVANGIQVVITQNSTPIYTGAPSALGFEALASCALGDVIAITLSSSASCDQPRNTVKSNIGIWS